MESTTRKIKWKLKNVTEDKLKPRDNDNPAVSSRFHISIGGTSYEWYLKTSVNDGWLEFFLRFDREYAKALTITCRMGIGKDIERGSFTVDSKTDLTGVGYGWNKFIALNELVNPAKNYIDEKKRLILNVELTLKRAARPQQPEPIIPPTVGEASFAEFMYDDDYSDASFTCSDNVKIEVHRIVLAKKSAEFKKIFASMKQQNQRNRRFPYDSMTMKEILNFAYTGSADPKDIQMVKKIYEASVTFDLPELQLQCVDSLNNQISIETVLDIFRVANDLKLNELTEKCLTCIMKFFHQLKSTQEWRNLDVYLKEKVINAFADNYSDIELETVL